MILALTKGIVSFKILLDDVTKSRDLGFHYEGSQSPEKKEKRNDCPHYIILLVGVAKSRALRIPI